MEDKTRRKLLQAIRKTTDRIIGQWFKKLTGSEGIYEFRIEDNGKFYRLFAFWDNSQQNETLIVGNHGLIKKSNKTPIEDIRKAERIMKEYIKENDL